MATISENLKTIKDSTEAIKNAILDKGGTIEGNLTTYASAIANLPSGGGGGDVNPTAEKNDVTFYDYDGTIRYSYTAKEFLALTEMPPLPTQKGLICQEWNWSHEDAVEYVSEYGILDVGATYITDDGKTRLYIRIAAEGRMDVPLYFQQTVANGVTIDWGDGSATETLGGTGKVNTTHHYNSVGDYIISLDVADGCTLILGHGTTSFSVIGSTEHPLYRTILYKVELGTNIASVGAYAFYQLYNLTELTIPSYITSFGNNLSNSTIIRAVVVPRNIPSMALSFMGANPVIFKIILPSNVGSFSAQGFRSLRNLSSFVIPSNIKSIPTLCFDGCYSLANIIIPSGVSLIEQNAFRDCSGMTFYDFSHHTSTPTLANTNAFTGIPTDCKIIVPDALYDEWIAATNWSTYATYIIKKTDWDNL